MKFETLIKIFLVVLISSVVCESQAFQGKKGRKTAERPKVEQAAIDPNQPPIVERVLSGDLFLLKNGEVVRLMGADAPVLPTGDKPGQEPWATVARVFAESLVLGKEIKVDGLGLKTDEYGRKYGLVYVGETWIDYELVKNGYAVVQHSPYLDTKLKQKLLEVQREAIANSIGIWDKNSRLPQPPREFRAANHISEGDDSKVDSWKRAAAPKSTPVNITSSPTTQKPPSNPTEAADQVLEALKNIQARKSAGLTSNGFEGLVKIANDRFQTMRQNPPSDRYLVRDLKDALDAYQLVLDAFKRRETAPAIEKEKFNQYIEKALDISDQAITAASKKIEILKNQPAQQ
ncbi:MAG: thermonuclease family protein [Blastocatellia bacterium]|nr:thermonuclease family protein [Blastocatellia bacterium]